MYDVLPKHRHVYSFEMWVISRFVLKKIVLVTSLTID